MARGNAAVGFLLFILLGLALAYVAGTGFLALWRTGSAETLDFTALIKEYPGIRAYDPQAYKILNLIFIGSIVVVGFFAGNFVTERLTMFGTTHWQSIRELKRNGFLTPAGSGFVLAKAGSPASRAKMITSKTFPHCLLVAPTGAGKGVGFVVPNLLLFKGSAVVLDVKGENFEKTARHRAKMGDKVWRFAPLDFENPGHRYNPLLRVYEMKNPDQQQSELRSVANLFLQSDSSDSRGLLDGGIDLFIACGIYAFERGTPTLGEIYRLASSGGDKQQQYQTYSLKVRSPAAKLIFERLGSTNDRTLTSYLSLLMTSGLSVWDNPAIDRATETSDFSFRDFRRTPNTAYFIAPPHEKIRSIAPLARLFFGDLLSSLHDHEPKQDEPWRVMIMLDEFDMLGKMPSVTDGIKTLRSFGGHLAIVTQTIPAIDEIYGENTRLSLQGNAGVKLYLAPSEKETVSELSAAVGMTTKRVVSRSRTVGRGSFQGVNVSERTEEKPLLTEDEARRMNSDDVIMIINGQFPIRAKRIKYYDDRMLKPIFEAQSGHYPQPSAGGRELQDLRAEMRELRAEVAAKPTQLRSRARAVLSDADLAAAAKPFLNPPPASAPAAETEQKPDGLAGQGASTEPATAPITRRRGFQSEEDSQALATSIERGAANIALMHDVSDKMDAVKAPADDAEVVAA